MQRVRESITEFHDPTEAFSRAVGDVHSMSDVFFPDGNPVGHMTKTGNALFADAVGEAVSGFAERACPAES